MYCFCEKGVRTREWEEILKISQPHPSTLLTKKQRPRKQTGYDRVDLPQHGTVGWLTSVWHFKVAHVHRG